MMSRDTVNNARIWYATGVNWVEKEAINLGIAYLDRAIPVFADIGDLRTVSRARHHRLLALQKGQRHDEVETDGDEVLETYVRTQDFRGQSLLLAHMSESMVRMDRWERGMVQLNLSEAIAETHGIREISRYVCERKAHLFLERESPVMALRMLKRAEDFCAEDALEPEVARLRAARGSALARMGERNEAVGLLEDAQSRFIRLGRFHEALEALVVLGKVYQSMGQTDDETRSRELMHFCGQRVLKKDDNRRRVQTLGPPVDPALVPKN